MMNKEEMHEYIHELLELDIQESHEQGYLLDVLAYEYITSVCKVCKQENGEENG